MLFFSIFNFQFSIPAFSGETRIASDYEIAAIQEGLAREKNPIAQIAGYLNLGDQQLSRQQTGKAAEAFHAAFDGASKQRRLTRLRSQLGDYALATTYQALASAKLGHKAEAFDLFEEATRYASNSDKVWNLYASAMMLLDEGPKAVDAARNAVSIAETRLRRRQDVADILDLAVDRYTLAGSLMQLGDAAPQEEARALLGALLNDLKDERLNALRKEIVRKEMFEVYSTTRNDESTYIALLNRSHLGRASIYEKRFQFDRARAEYLEILKARSDDPVALQRLARLTKGSDEKSSSFQKAFDANPFAPGLLLDYENYLAKGGAAPDAPATTGTAVRQVLEAIVAGRYREASAGLTKLNEEFPGNESLAYLGSRVASHLGDSATASALRENVHDPELRAVLDQAPANVASASALLSRTGAIRDPAPAELASLLQLLSGNPTPSQMAALDQLTFSSRVSMENPAEGSAPGTTAFTTGRIGDLPFRFQEQTAFRGTFERSTPLRLEFRILGVTELDGHSALLVDPTRLERE